ncbi:hypothetical protein [Fibrella forsythiae]|uniref:DUF4402 domain-containing protein n=1 Tax=Fibrella forsythiae TaxID=2817061 RepID=A0ABS3JFG6_9BACT|nr:hypothetical protein [Fibrella forsythiae]MBO0948178.1 hypothetical protein [Fibrella forsythiae]
MNKQTRFLTLLGFLLLGGAVHVHAQMGGHVPQTSGGSRPATNNGDVNPAGAQPDLDIMDSHAPAPTVVMAGIPEKLTDFSTESGKPSSAKKFTLSGNVANAGLTAPQGFEISLQESIGYSSSLKVGHPPVTIWVRLTGSKPNGMNTAVSGDINVSGSNGQIPNSSTARVHVEGVVR